MCTGVKLPISVFSFASSCLVQLFKCAEVYGVAVSSLRFLLIYFFLRIRLGRGAAHPPFQSSRRFTPTRDFSDQKPHTLLGILQDIKRKEQPIFIAKMPAIETSFTDEDREDFVLCARYGELEELIAYLDNGMNIAAKDPHGNTALHMAAGNGHAGGW